MFHQIENELNCSNHDSSDDEFSVYDEIPVERNNSSPFCTNNVPCILDADNSATLKARLGIFLLSEDLADIHFLTKDSDTDEFKKIPAHKFILASGSCVFKAMLFGPVSKQEKEIFLPDIDCSTLTSLLRFIYTDEVDICPSNLVTTLYAAKKYQVPNLEKACVNYLSWSLSNDNVLVVLSQAILFDEIQLIDLCWKKIEDNIDEVINASSFERIEHSTLILLLERNGLPLREIDLFKACIRWAKYQCKQKGISQCPSNYRQVLGEALFLIRFPCMTGYEFAFSVIKEHEGILNNAEITTVFSYFAYSTQKQIKSTKYFSVEPRTKCGKWPNSLQKEVVLTRFSEAACGRLCMFDEIHKIDFIVNMPIYMTGIGVYGTRCEKGERILNTELRQSETGDLLATGHLKIKCTGKPKIYQVRFRLPAPIKPNTIYTASAEFNGNYPYPTYYGINGRRICSLNITDESKNISKEIRFTFFKSEKNSFLDTGGEQGQIPQILFYV